MSKTMKRVFGLGLILILTMGLLAACSDNTDNSKNANNTNETTNEANNNEANNDKKVLKMGTSADYPPFESRNPDGEFVGFDIELGQLIAEELGYELEIEDMKFGGLIGALQADRLDMVLSGMSANENRKKNVDFSTEYHRSGEMFLTKTDAKVEELTELDGKVVGVQLGSIQEEGAENLQEEYNFEVKKVDDAAILIQELLSNRIDVVYMDKEVAVGYVEEQGLFGLEDTTSSSPGMGVAFPKGSDLVDPVNEILEKFEEDGTMQELKDKWLSE